MQRFIAFSIGIFTGLLVSLMCPTALIVRVLSLGMELSDAMSEPLLSEFVRTTGFYIALSIGPVTCGVICKTLSLPSRKFPEFLVFGTVPLSMYLCSWFGHVWQFGAPHSVLIFMSAILNAGLAATVACRTVGWYLSCRVHTDCRRLSSADK